MSYDKSESLQALDLWKYSLLTMPDDSFYELIHSALGKIKTPFNKQQLIKDLESFLRRKDIQEAIAAYIDAWDAKVITAVNLFGKPTRKELEKFFDDEFSYMQLYDIIVNLEERFILYCYKDSESRSFDQYKLAINPVLEKVLAPFTEDFSILFPAKPAGAARKSNKSKTILNDCIIAGLLSFIYAMKETPFYKKEGQLRKQILAAANACFPDLALEEILRTLQVLGLFYIKDECLIPDEARFADFALLSSRERMEYCAAAMLVLKEQVQSLTEIQAPYYKNRVREAFNFIHALIDLITMIQPLNEHYPEKTIVKLAQVLKSKTRAVMNINNLIEVIQKSRLNFSLLPSPSSLPSITINSGFSIFVYPQIDFSDAVEIASFLNIKETGAVTRFELEKESAVRAFNKGITAQRIIDSLNRLSGNNVPEPLVWNLKDWEKRYGEVSLKRGIVLTLSEDKQYLAETKPLSALISETLAPGVYLLNEAADEKAAEALRNAGIDIIARAYLFAHPAAHKKGSAGKNEKPFKFHLQNYFTSAAPAEVFPKVRTVKTSDKKTVSSESGIPAIKKDFYTILDKMPLDKADRDVLSARIERRLILCESQLKEANIRYEKLEARNMDYTGKYNIVKQAISQNCHVEIVVGKKHFFGIPRALEKEGNAHPAGDAPNGAPNGGCILVVTPDGEDAQSSDCVRIPLAKISLIRRIKKSIFES